MLAPPRTGAGASRWLLLFGGWYVFELLQSAMWPAVRQAESTSMPVISVFAFYLPLAWIWALLTPAVGWWSRTVRNRYSSVLVRFLSHVPLVVVSANLHTFGWLFLAAALGYPLTISFLLPHHYSPIST